ncbi:MAG: hypothetical protein JWP63_570 [Candidatus Solibacter sp.]|nr:hypothetical protein [Candidatus Solibacter sp.]
MTNRTLRVFALTAFALPLFAAGSKKAFIEPAQPKWGEKVQLIYRSDLVDAALRPTDSAIAIVNIWSPGEFEQRRIPMVRAGDQLRAEFTVPNYASYIACDFVTKETVGGPASAMIYTAEGKPARDAWHQSMLRGSGQPDANERAARELALYPDNWEVFRDKWFMDRSAQRAATIQADLARIEREAKDRPLAALYALSYGHLLLDHEAGARAALGEMVERFSHHHLTAYALSSYGYESFTRHFSGDGPAQVQQWSLDFYRRNPTSRESRDALDSVPYRIPLETVKTICEPWIADEPANPKPYFLLAQAYQHGEQAKAGLAAIEKALDLFADGQLRLHGDLYGKMTERLTPIAYLTAAELARDDGQFARAIAYVKAAENLGAETLAAPYGVEAQIWGKLGRTANQKAALKEAWQRGDSAAYAKLEARFPDALHESAPASKRKDAPAFHSVTFEGKALDSTDLRGKVVVANFWFTGCGPCKAEIPDLNRLTKEFAGKDVVFLAFTLDDDMELLHRFLKDVPFDYTIVPRSSAIADQFGVQSYPSHIVIGADGKIESMLMGGGPHRAEELKTIVARLSATQKDR